MDYATPWLHSNITTCCGQSILNQHTPGFLKSLSCGRQYVCMCVSAPRLLKITHMKKRLNNWLNKFCCLSVSLYGIGHQCS